MARVIKKGKYRPKETVDWSILGQTSHDITVQGQFAILNPNEDIKRFSNAQLITSQHGVDFWFESTEIASFITDGTGEFNANKIKAGTVINVGGDITLTTDKEYFATVWNSLFTAKEFRITNTLSHCTKLSGPVEFTQSATLMYKADTGYHLPQEMFADGAITWTWDVAKGELIINSADSDVNVSINAKTDISELAPYLTDVCDALRFAESSTELIPVQLIPERIRRLKKI